MGEKPVVDLFDAVPPHVQKEIEAKKAAAKAAKIAKKSVQPARESVNDLFDDQPLQSHSEGSIARTEEEVPQPSAEDIELEAVKSDFNKAWEADVAGEVNEEKNESEE